MPSHRVRVGARYLYTPVAFDTLHPPYDLTPGDIVTVVNLPGCPRANTMGMCYVNNPAGQFGGMVCTNSLQPLRAAKG